MNKVVLALPFLLVLWIPTCYLWVFQPWHHQCYIKDQSWSGWLEHTYVDPKDSEYDCGKIYKGMTMGKFAAYSSHDFFGSGTKYFDTLEQAETYVEQYCTPNPSLNPNR